MPASTAAAISKPPTKRARVQTDEQTATHMSLNDRLPCIVRLPSNLSAETESMIEHKYFNPTTNPNSFVYTAILNSSQHATMALITLDQAGAFSSVAGRQALLNLIKEAQQNEAMQHRSESCTDELLAKVEQYTQYAYCLEDDGVTVGCGDFSGVGEVGVV